MSEITAIKKAVKIPAADSWRKQNLRWGDGDPLAWRVSRASKDTFAGRAGTYRGMQRSCFGSHGCAARWCYGGERTPHASRSVISGRTVLLTMTTKDGRFTAACWTSSFTNNPWSVPRVCFFLIHWAKENRPKAYLQGILTHIRGYYGIWQVRQVLQNQ